MSSFVVLEDMEERVDWLRKFFPDVEIHWFTTVKGLCAHLGVADGIPPAERRPRWDFAHLPFLFNNQQDMLRILAECLKFYKDRCGG